MQTLFDIRYVAIKDQSRSFSCLLIVTYSGTLCRCDYWHVPYAVLYQKCYFPFFIFGNLNLQSIYIPLVPDPMYAITSISLAPTSLLYNPFIIYPLIPLSFSPIPCSQFLTLTPCLSNSV